MPNQFRVRVIRTPAGPAPEEVRKAWVGLELVAIDEHDGETLDFVEMKMVDRKRVSVMVPVLPALISLEKKDPSAAEWFRNNLPPFVTNFAFGADEVERF